MHRLPLHLRLPNPPPVFVGREAELAWLSAAIARGPMVLITGERDSGKSALLMRALHAQPEYVDQTVYLALRDGEQDPVGVALVRALAFAERVEDLAWRELRADPDALISVALDLAEHAGRWVVIEDLDHAEPTECAHLLARLARYGRRTRFLATAREPIGGLPRDLVDQCLALGPMPRADLSRLAQHLDPERAAELAPSWLEQASGSPGRLRRAISGAIEIGALPPDDLARLAMLATLQVPLPLDVTLRLMPGKVAMGDLERRGLVEISERGIRIRDRARDFVPPALAGSEAVRRFALAALETCAGADDPTTIFEAVRLACFAGRADKAREVLERAAPALLAAGFGVRLQRIVATSQEPVLDAWRMQLSLATDDPVMLDAIAPPASTDDLELAVLWATVLLARGKIEEAAAEARAVWRRACDAGDHGAAASVGIVLARALNNLRQHEESLVITSAIEPPALADRAERDAIAVTALGELGRHDEMRARLSEVAQTLGRLSMPQRAGVGQALARALYNAGQLRDAARLLDAVAEGNRPGMPPVMGRLLPFLRACIAIDMGDTLRGRAELDQLAPYVGKLLGPYYANARAMLALIDGDIDGIERWVADQEAPPLEPWVRSEREALRLAVRELKRLPAEDLAPTSGQKRGVFGPLAQLRRAHVDLHAGEQSPQEVCESLPSPEHPELSILADIVRADAAIASSDPRSATKIAAAARRRAKEIGYAAHTARALQGLCDAALVAGDQTGLERSLDELESLAREMPSRRFAGVASWYRATLAFDVAALEAIAGSRRAPDVALRASAQLGDDTLLGSVDRIVLAAHAARVGWRPPGVVDKSAVGERWGIDEPRAALWFEDGASLDLSKQRALFKLIVCLARRGGRATKEQLVEDAWDEPSYHPLRHDNRLHAAVRKLRLRIEQDAATPSRLLTTEDGYALGGRVRWVRP